MCVCVRVQSCLCMGEWKYSSARSHPRHFVDMRVQLHASANLSPGREPPVLIKWDFGWLPEPECIKGITCPTWQIRFSVIISSACTAYALCRRSLEVCA